MTTTRTRWLPAGWGIVCSHKLDGKGWRYEAHIGGEKIAWAGQFRTNAEADRAAKSALRAWAYEHLEFVAGQRRYHAAFGGKTLCGLPSDCAPLAHSTIGIGNVDCLRCGTILNAIEEEMETT